MTFDMKIDTGRVIGRPNPKMWGVFYEEINHAGDGGLYAEMIRNRSFADACVPEGTIFSDGNYSTRRGFREPFDTSDPLPGWTLRKTSGACAVMERTNDAPRNPECPEQLKLSVIAAGNGVRAVNSGFWGFSLRPIAYNGFIILRGEGISAVTAGFMYKSGDVIVKNEIPVTDGFVKQPLSLDCSVAEADARFFVEADQPGTLLIDFVSLFPSDACGVFRKDVFSVLNGLKPGFLRFPGGCVVEGFSLANAIHWKKTRGPIEDRPGHWDLWSYRATDGMGMLEFCKLGEMLGADLMYVVNCGMSCQWRECEPGSDEEIAWWLQNALDGIEYITGGADTEWGRRRAEDGHPEPFDLKYVEIGNENRGPEYEKRYPVFYEAIKARYPDLTLIANTTLKDLPMDMVDDHYYTAPQTFPAMYDRYGEDGTPVYVGEYACNTEVGYGNVLSAVSEACFMIRMENRGDRIRIASYAPLFCNENDRKWPVNLINYNGSTAYGIPSYEVQKSFAENAVSEVYAIEGVVPDPAALYITAGKSKDGLIVKIAHFSETPGRIVLHADGIADGPAAVSTLAGETPQDTNNAAAPRAVHMTASECAVKDGCLAVELPPYSFLVVKIV